MPHPVIVALLEEVAKSGLTEKQIAEKINVFSSRWLVELRKGSIANPGVNNLELLAEFFGKTIVLK